MCFAHSHLLFVTDQSRFFYPVASHFFHCCKVTEREGAHAPPFLLLNLYWGGRAERGLFRVEFRKLVFGFEGVCVLIVLRRWNGARLESYGAIIRQKMGHSPILCLMPLYLRCRSFFCEDFYVLSWCTAFEIRARRGVSLFGG